MTSVLNTSGTLGTSSTSASAATVEHALQEAMATVRAD